MQKTLMPSLVILLAVAVGALGYAYYQEHRNSTSIELKVAPNGISVERN